jgi:hypothetical protein
MAILLVLAVTFFGWIILGKWSFDKYVLGRDYEAEEKAKLNQAMQEKSRQQEEEWRREAMQERQRQQKEEFRRKLLTK